MQLHFISIPMEHGESHIKIMCRALPATEYRQYKKRLNALFFERLIKNVNGRIIELIQSKSKAKCVTDADIDTKQRERKEFGSRRHKIPANVKYNNNQTQRLLLNVTMHQTGLIRVYRTMIPIRGEDGIILILNGYKMRNIFRRVWDTF